MILLNLFSNITFFTTLTLLACEHLRSFYPLLLQFYKQHLKLKYLVINIITRVYHQFLGILDILKLLWKKILHLLF